MRLGQLVFGAAITAALTVPAAAQSDVSRILNRLRTGNTQPATAPDAPPPVFTEQAITAAPMAITVKKWMGQQKAFEIFPTRVVVAGYNVGGFREGKTTGRASGGFMTTNPGAATTVEIVAWGIDAPLLTRIANAAYGDLLVQLRAAGFEVVTLDQARGAAGFPALKLDAQPYEVSVPADRGNMKGLVVGPAPAGVRSNFPLARTEFGSFGAPELSMTLQSMVVMPNLMFDFASLRSSKSIGFTARASADLGFDIAKGYSQFRVMASRRKQFAEGDYIFGVDKAEVPDTPIGAIVDSSETDNSDQRAFARSLGTAIQARSKQSSTVQINQRQYEALALSAARGWNAAFVAALRAQTSGQPR